MNKSGFVVLLVMNFFKLFFKYLFKILFSKEPFLVEVDGIKLLLPKHSLDVLIPAETFLDKNYEPLFKPSKNPKLVIDLGSHVGDFSIWASRRFKNSKIIAVEMDKYLYKLLNQNLVLNKVKNTIVTINKAVHRTSNMRINIQRVPILTAANLETKIKTSFTAETISLNDLYLLGGNKIIDFLKIDIEGAEKYLLTSEYKNFFRYKVRFVAIECHRFSGVWPKEAEKYFKSIGFITKFQKITSLNILNELLHAKNKNL